MIRINTVFAISVLISLVVGFVDYRTGAQISMLLLYAVPILAAAWFCGRIEGVIVAFIAAVCWLIANFMNRSDVFSGTIFSWEFLTRLGIFILIAYTVSLQASLKQALARERQLANTDRLTGLLNKEALRERVEQEMVRSQRYNHPLSLAFIDLDNFKQVNDTRGHAVGDKLLRQVSATIMNSIRTTDLAGRIGGDEFVVCFPETGDIQVRSAIAKLVLELDIMTSQSGWQVTASIGVVTCVTVSETYDSLLGKADKLMYLAKEKGKNAAEFTVLDGNKTNDLS